MDTQVSTASAAQARLDRRGIGWFLLLNFALTWAIFIPMVAPGASLASPTTKQTLLMGIAMLVPGLTAFIVRKWVTREGFATAGLRFGSWRPYVAILLAVPVLFGLISIISYALGWAQFDPSMSTMLEQLRALSAAAGVEAPLPDPTALLVSTLVGTMTIGPIITSVATFGEEFGWTGYLFPKLLPLGKWRAVITYGLIWGLWHAPIIYAGYNFPGYGWVGVAMMCLATVVMGLIQGALRLQYRSVLVTTWAHAMFNTQARGIWMLLFVGASPMLGGPIGLVGLLLMGALGLWLLKRAPEPQGE